MKNRFRLSLMVAFVGLTILSCQESEPSHFNVNDFGASGKKSQLVTDILQKAIDACHEAGGGVVYLPPGDFLSGTIVLKSNVTLHLEAGATLWASKNESDFISDKVVKEDDAGREGAGQTGETPVLIYANGARHIGITGKGIIHGQAVRDYRELEMVDGFIADITENARQSGVEMKRYYKVRPYTCLVFIEDCEYVTVRDVSLVESMDWTLHFKWSRRIFVDNVYIESCLESGVNADGIDIDGCQDVVISNCIISTGDDAIVLKTTISGGKSQPCDNITVTNCVLTSTSSALKLGTESHNDFRNINFTNCVIRNSNRGLSIVIRDGGTAENIVFSDIVLETNRKHFNWWGNGDPIWLVVKQRFPHSKVGRIKNVVFQNIIAHGQGTSKIEGFSGNSIENIRLRNVQLNMYPEAYADKRADDGFFASEVEGLTLNDVEIAWHGNPEPAWRHAFSFHKVSRLHLKALSGMQAPTNTGVFVEMRQIKDAVVEGCWPYDKTGTFLRLNGYGNESIQLSNNYLSEVRQEVETVNGASAGVVKKL